MPAGIDVSQRIIHRIRVAIPCLATSYTWNNSIRLRKTPQLRIDPARVEKEQAKIIGVASLAGKSIVCGRDAPEVYPEGHT
jgi:hypothetical protein